jgi:hypothetical protein
MTEDAKSKVLLTLEHGVIVAKRYQYVSDGLMGAAVLCEDGTSKLYVVDQNPTFRQYYGIDVAPGSTYEETRKAVLDATGWSSEEEFQWAETDEKGDLIPGTDTEGRLQAWLNSHLDDNYDLLETWGAREASEYAPGFELMHCLPIEDVKRLSLREGDLGGPASSVPCVSTRASASELNAVISAHALPFLVVDDEGSEEY